jgi:hypothetical protein
MLELIYKGIVKQESGHKPGFFCRRGGFNPVGAGSLQMFAGNKGCL